MGCHTQQLNTMNRRGEFLTLRLLRSDQYPFLWIVFMKLQNFLAYQLMALFLLMLAEGRISKKIFGSIKISSQLGQSSSFPLQPCSEVASSPWGHVMSWGFIDTHILPITRCLPPGPGCVCFRTPAWSVQLCKPRNGFCPALIFSWINSCPRSLNPVSWPHISWIFPFSANYGLA